jgi:RNA 3'-terminal phosphate cyclase (ATP)
MLKLDGSTLEGGGQLIRVALCLSALLRIPIHIDNIRANRAAKSAKTTRQGGGLKESHLAALVWLAKTSGAKIEGAKIGSPTVTFNFDELCIDALPSLEEKRNAIISLERPGSVWLILQAILPYIMFGLTSPVFDLTLRGGTNVGKSMSGEYVQQVLLPTLCRIGISGVSVDIMKRGWAGGRAEIGEVRVRVKKVAERCKLPGFDIAGRGEVVKLAVTILAHGDMRDLLRQEVVHQCREKFEEKTEIDIVIDEESGHPLRLYVLTVAHTADGCLLGRDVLYEKRTKNERELKLIAEKVVADVLDQMQRELDTGGCVDEYMQDQLIIWQALADGKSVVDAGWRLGGSLHSQTVRWVCREMLSEKVRFEAVDGSCV